MKTEKTADDIRFMSMSDKIQPITLLFYRNTILALSKQYGLETQYPKRTKD